MQNALNNAQKRYLKGLAHTLKPVILVGGKGISDGLVNETIAALDIHELIKVKIAAEDRDTRNQWLNELIEQTDAQLVTRIGNVGVLYRRHPKNALITLPKS